MGLSPNYIKYDQNYYNSFVHLPVGTAQYKY